MHSKLWLLPAESWRRTIEKLQPRSDDSTVIVNHVLRRAGRVRFDGRCERCLKQKEKHWRRRQASCLHELEHSLATAPNVKLLKI